MSLTKREVDITGMQERGGTVLVILNEVSTLSDNQEDISKPRALWGHGTGDHKI